MGKPAVVEDQHNVTTTSGAHHQTEAIPPAEVDVQTSAMREMDLDESEAQVQPRQKMRLYATLLALYLTQFLASLDQTVIATAIPSISSNLHSASGYTWIGGAYLLARAASGPIWAKLSDIWGRKPILLGAVALFFFSSMLCALAKTMGMLLVGRAIQGVAGGGLMQLIVIIISDLFSMRSRSLYFGFLEVVWAISAGIGPTLGGAFAQFNWRWIFWINLPTSGVAFIVILLFLNVHNPRTKLMEGVRAIDWFGSLSIVGLTLMLLLGLEFGGEVFPWSSPKVICLLVFGAFMSVFFIIAEKRFARYPLMPLKLFNNRSNVAALVLGFLQGMVFIAGEYYLPLYFQSVQEASPLKSGVLILPVVIMEALTGIATGVIIHQTGRYLELIWVGTVLMTLGTGLYIMFDVSTSIAVVVILQIISGIGCGLLFEPPYIAMQAQASQNEVATATATLGFVKGLATSFSVVIGGVVFQNSMKLRRSSFEASGLPSNLTDLFAGGEAAANLLLIPTITDPAHKLVLKEAFAWSLRNMWIMYTSLSALTIIAGLFVSKHVLSKEHVETKTGLHQEQEPMQS